MKRNTSVVDVPISGQLQGMDRRRFFFTAGAGMAGALAAGNLAGISGALAAGEIPPSYRTPSYRDLYGGK